MRRRDLVAALCCLAASAAAQPSPKAPTPAPPAQDYLLFVASEGNDRIALVRFGPKGFRVDRERKIGTNPSELLGPHGLYVSPDGKWYYVTTAHGTPTGAIYKFATADDSAAGRTELGAFPATVQVAPNGHYAWVVNFNLYGRMVPSTVSVVYDDQMVEVKRIPTCIMPHGSRLSPDGTKHYSACMMNDVVVEIDAEQMAVARAFVLTKGSEHAVTGSLEAVAMSAACSPTWAQPSVDGRTLWVACNKSNDIVELDVATWSMRRRIAAGDGIYNLAVTHDGTRLVGTNKRGKSVSVIEIATGHELARVPTTRRVPSGLVVSPDDRYVFVTLEGVGAEPGTVDVIDLRALVRVASVDVGQQAGGIDYWKTETAK